MLVQSAGLC